MNKYVNAEYIFETLRKHHRLLKELTEGVTEIQLQDEFYDDVIDL